jgi:hypothetical protein
VRFIRFSGYNERHCLHINSIPFPENYADRRTFARDVVSLGLADSKRNLINLSKHVVTYLNDLNLYDEYLTHQISRHTAGWLEEFLLSLGSYYVLNLTQG